MRLDEFDYELPEALIAQHPPPSRGASRLLRMDGASGALEDAHFRDLPGFLRPHDLLVFNDTRVIKARLSGRKASGGRVEVLVERILDGNHALAQVRASHAPREGATLHLAGDLTATVTGRLGEFFQLRFEGDTPVFEALERAGSVPLPPYITPAPEAVDEDRYQTVFAREPGAVAAPTAGLHFDAAMLARLAEARGDAAAGEPDHQNVTTGEVHVSMLDTRCSMLDSGCPILRERSLRFIEHPVSSIEYLVFFTSETPPPCRRWRPAPRSGPDNRS